uniref:Uncharacterized protein n=1 Tax=Daphnia galeata TaxID=27404 RepID=A0A8J2WLM8_9CRUS|nr:unnamed protein product [Daphnia galeata]
MRLPFQMWLQINPSNVNMRLKLKLSSPVQGTHQGSVGGLQVHLLIQHWKKVTKSVKCATWDCYDALLIDTIKVVGSDMNHSDTEPDSDSDEESYVDCEEAMVVSLLLSVRYVLGELVTPSSTDIDGHEKGKQAKQRTRSICYLGLNEDKVAFKSTTICEIVIEAVREVQNALTKDAVENKIKNWLRHCPRYKHNEYGSRNGVDEDQQEDAD